MGSVEPSQLKEDDLAARPVVVGEALPSAPVVVGQRTGPKLQQPAICMGPHAICAVHSIHSTPVNTLQPSDVIVAKPIAPKPNRTKNFLRGSGVNWLRLDIKGFDF